MTTYILGERLTGSSSQLPVMANLGPNLFNLLVGQSFIKLKCMYPVSYYKHKSNLTSGIFRYTFKVVKSYLPNNLLLGIIRVCHPLRYPSATPWNFVAK